MFHNAAFRKALIILFWILVWWILAVVVDNSILLVTPLAVAVRLVELVVLPAFWQGVTGSFLRIAMGFCGGFLVAVVLAGISLRCELMEEFLKPVMSLVKTVPVASFVVLLLIWWGSDSLAVSICFLVVLPNIYINTLEGLKNADKRLLEMAQVFRMTAGNRFFYIYRAALKPFLISGLRIALGMCWKSGVAAEVIGITAHSIGGQLYLSKISLDTSGVFAWTAVVILLSTCFEKGILKLADWFLVWEPALKKRDGRHQRAESTDVLDKRYGNTADKRGSIVLNRVNKSFGEKKVLEDLSASYEAGETYYLTSPSGSGKTTLLRVLSGLEKAESGEIEGSYRCSMVFQEDRLCEEYSAIRNVALVTGNEAGAREALGRLLEPQALTQPCRELSGGMKRRVALVRAMEAESEVVLLDEPFAGMDTRTRQMAEAYIRERQCGRILIIVTHI